jgi:hypothetical protein
MALAASRTVVFVERAARAARMDESSGGGAPFTSNSLREFGRDFQELSTGRRARRRRKITKNKKAGEKRRESDRGLG